MIMKNDNWIDEKSNYKNKFSTPFPNPYAPPPSLNQMMKKKPDERM